MKGTNQTSHKNQAIRSKNQINQSNSNSQINPTNQINQSSQIDLIDQTRQIQKVAELTGVPLVSCRPWLCMPHFHSGGAIRPVAALLPQHFPMTVSEVRALTEARYNCYWDNGRVSPVSYAMILVCWVYRIPVFLFLPLSSVSMARQGKPYPPPPPTRT